VNEHSKQRGFLYVYVFLRDQEARKKIYTRCKTIWTRSLSLSRILTLVLRLNKKKDEKEIKGVRVYTCASNRRKKE